MTLAQALACATRRSPVIESPAKFEEKPKEIERKFRRLHVQGHKSILRDCRDAGGG